MVHKYTYFVLLLQIWCVASVSPCTFSQWKNSGICTSGKQLQTRTSTNTTCAPLYQFVACKDCVVSAWNTNAACVKGEKTYTRKVTTKPTGTGAKCPALTSTVSCNDCFVSDWSTNNNCIEGKQVQTRKVIVKAGKGGKACPALNQTVPCNNCSVSAWINSGLCTNDKQTQVRDVTKNQANGGACVPLVQTVDCIIFNITIQSNTTVFNTKSIINITNHINALPNVTQAYAYQQSKGMIKVQISTTAPTSSAGTIINRIISINPGLNVNINCLCTINSFISQDKIEGLIKGISDNIDDYLCIDSPGFKNSFGIIVDGNCCARSGKTCSAYYEEYNGCGPSNSPIRYALTQFFITLFGPAGTLDAFTPFCDVHDICYTTPEFSQDYCDTQLKENLVSVCNTVYPSDGGSICGQYSNNNNGLDCKLVFSQQNARCINDANNVYTFVVDAGSDPYTTAQQQQQTYIDKCNVEQNNGCCVRNQGTCDNSSPMCCGTANSAPDGTHFCSENNICQECISLGSSCDGDEAPLQCCPGSDPEYPSVIIGCVYGVCSACIDTAGACTSADLCCSDSEECVNNVCSVPPSQTPEPCAEPNSPCTTDDRCCNRPYYYCDANRLCNLCTAIGSACSYGGNDRCCDNAQCTGTEELSCTKCINLGDSCTQDEGSADCCYGNGCSDSGTCVQCLGAGDSCAQDGSNGVCCGPPETDCLDGICTPEPESPYSPEPYNYYGYG